MPIKKVPEEIPFTKSQVFVNISKTDKAKLEQAAVFSMQMQNFQLLLADT